MSTSPSRNNLEKQVTKCLSSEINSAPPISDCWKSIIHEIREEYLDTCQSYPWVVGFSGGKDSTVVAHAVFEALFEIAPYKRTRPVHILSNDTLVESPLVIQHLNSVTGRISEAARALGLPITVARTKPEITNTFWVLLIGKGYPSPNLTMRWCTDRLKILPTNKYIKEQVSQSGAAIVVLGVRRDESMTRMRSIDKHVNIRGARLTEHEKLPGAYIYRPIVDLSTVDVWDILMNFHAPWGGSHTDLIQLYKDAKGGDCPAVPYQEKVAACGAANSRFGCWTCTVVTEDKSLQGFVNSGNIQYEPLIEFRDWLREIRNDPSMRQALRRNGKLTFAASGQHIPGPFTIQARKNILDRLFDVQDKYGQQLISDREIDLIYQHWAAELHSEKGLIDD
ncbi:MAG: DNA phosphorothioation system sulfurtransferase DndC [Desulfovibrionaceae bacterium]